MSAGYEVVQSDIRDAAADLQAVADGVDGADPSSAVADIVAAMPGSASSAAASLLTGTWSGRFRTWSQDAGQRSQALATNADNYDAAEHAAAERFRSIPYAGRPQ